MTCAFDPAPLDQPLILEAVECRIQRRDVKADRALRSLVDQASDFIAVPRLLLEQREDQHFGASPLQLALERRDAHMWRDNIFKRTTCQRPPGPNPPRLLPADLHVACDRDAEAAAKFTIAWRLDDGDNVARIEVPGDVEQLKAEVRFPA